MLRHVLSLQRVVSLPACLPEALLLWPRCVDAQRALLSSDAPPPQPAAFARLWQELLHSQTAAAPSLQLIKQHLAACQRHGVMLPPQACTSLMAFYRGLAPEQRAPFLVQFASQLGVQEEDVASAVAAWPPPSASAGAPGGQSADVLRAAERLRAAALPLYGQLFGPLSREPGGIAFLVQLRAHVRSEVARRPTAGIAPLRALDEQLKQALSGWFTPGLLELRRLTWDNTTAALRDKLRRYEAVHRIADEVDMRRRLGPGRRVHAYFHPALPGEPLAILHAALLDRVPASLGEVLLLPSDDQVPAAGASSDGAVPDAPSPAPPATAQAPPPAAAPRGGALASEAQAPPSVAAFYSISSTQPGLAGVDLGHFLIVQVATKLQAEQPSVRHLVTLSPLPGFRAWLKAKLLALAAAEQQLSATSFAPAPSSSPSPSSSSAPSPALTSQAAASDLHASSTASDEWVAVRPGALPAPPLLTPEEAEAVAVAAPHGLVEAGALEALEAEARREGRRVPAALRLLAVLEGGRWLQAPGQGGGEGAHAAVQAALPAIRRVLLRAAATYLLLERRRGLALDPVAHFHLRNGAQLLRINFGANTRPAGIESAYGIMVNYRYDLAAAHANQWRYLAESCVQAAPSLLQHLSLPEAVQSAAA